jgi:hypothetical protein
MAPREPPSGNDPAQLVLLERPWLVGTDARLLLAGRAAEFYTDTRRWLKGGS